MLTQPNLEEQTVIADTLQRPRLTMTASERLAEALLSCGFAVAVVLLWRLAPPGGFALAPALVCLLVLVLAGRCLLYTSSVTVGEATATVVGRHQGALREAAA